MINGVGQNAGWQVQNQTEAGSQQKGTRESGVSEASSRGGDSVYLSEEALKLQLSTDYSVAQIDPDGLLLDSTAGKMAGTTNLGLKKYLGLNGKYSDTSLAAMNASRKTIGQRIENILRGKGIKLGKDEKFSFSVDGNNNIVVSGLKDQAKADAIAKALNEDKQLAKEMRKHVATGKINDAARKQAAYEKQMGELGVDTAGIAEEKGTTIEAQFTDRNLRTFVIDEYLQDTVGMGIADLQHERDADGKIAIVGMNDELRRLFDEDPELAATVGNMLENGETKSDFKVTFEYANGAISDSTTDSAARDKVEGVKAYLMGGVDENGNVIPGMIDDLREKLMSQGVAKEEEYKKLMAFVSKGFSIRVGVDGKYDIVGAEKLGDRQVGMLKNIVEKALEAWAAAGNPFSDPTYFHLTDHRTNNFADVAETFVEQHRFEHGDVDEFEHQAEINFSASGADMIKVVSPDADKAQETQNQETADEMGKQLKSYLEYNGVEVGAGLEVEMDDNGKFKVLGDANDPNIKKAQQLLDQFAKESKAVSGPDGGQNGDDEDKPADAVTADRRAERGETKSYYEKYHRQKLVEEAIEEVGVGTSYSDYRKLNLYIGWKTIMAKGLGGPVDNSNVLPVSNIKAPRQAEGGDGAGSPRTLAMDDANYSGDAKGLYRKLLDGMGQFHDERKNVKYKFMIN